MEYKELRNSINTSKSWLDDVLKTLSKNKIIEYNSKTDSYFLNV